MQSAWLYFLIAVMLYIGVRAILRDARDPGRSASAESPTHELLGNGEFDLEVVGESHYQDSLKAVAGRGEVRKHVRAVLRLEPANKFDRNAVRVEIDGMLVGYLPREAAKQFTHGVVDTGKSTFAVNAVVVGGGEGRSLGVWLDIPVRQ